MCHPERRRYIDNGARRKAFLDVMNADKALHIRKCQSEKGCIVVNGETGREIGVVRDVKNLGASDIYYIEDKDGKEYMFPAVEEFLMGTDIKEKIIKIKVIEGMFSED